MTTRHNYIIILIDCLRKDFLSLYNKNLPYTTPHIDNLASEGCYISRLVSQSCWTKPVVASLFSGLYPFNHKVYGSYDKLMKRPNIASYFKREGYHTKAFSANPYITEDAGFGYGFDLFWLSESINGRLLSEKVINEFQKKSHPYFYYIHFMDTHAPYYPEGRFKKIAAQYSIKGGEKTNLNQDTLKKLVQLYQEAVQKTDLLIGELLQHVSLKNTNIVLFSDHGDELFEHGGLFHGAGKLYRENIEVPLILNGPDFIFSNKTNSFVNIVDLTPTILESAKIEYDPSQFDGKSFYSELSKDIEIKRITFSEVFAHSFNKNSEALIKDNYKLIRHSKKVSSELYKDAVKSFCHCIIKLDGSGIIGLFRKAIHFLERKFLLADKRRKSIELYDLINDPEELNDVAAALPEKVLDLADEIDKLKARVKTNEVGNVGRVNIDDDIKRRLKDLGYL